MKRVREIFAWILPSYFFATESAALTGAVASLSPTFTRNPGVKPQDVFTTLGTISSDLKNNVFFDARTDDYEALDNLLRDFLQAGQTRTQLRQAIADAVRVMEKVAETVHARILVEATNLARRKKAASKMAPIVMRGRLDGVDDKLGALVDAHAEVVVKMYDIDAAIDDAENDDENPAAVVRSELGMDLLISAGFLNLLRKGRRGLPVTSHFAYLVDWFYGPRFVTNERAIKFDGTRVTQYCIVEAADQMLYSVTPDVDAEFTLEHYTSLLFQMLFSLEAAWDVGGFVHCDFHLGNIMMQKVHDADVRSVPWDYRRAPRRHGEGKRRCRYVIDPSAHGGWSLKIIDFGSSRAWCSTAPDAFTKNRVLVTDPTNADIGRVTAVNDVDVDRSVDVRTFFGSLMFGSRPLVDDGANDEELHRRLKQVILVGSNVMRTGALFARLRNVLVTFEEKKFPADPAKAWTWLEATLGDWPCTLWKTRANLRGHSAIILETLDELHRVVGGAAVDAATFDEFRCAGLYDAVRAALEPFYDTCGRSDALDTFFRAVFLHSNPLLGWNVAPPTGSLTPSTLIALPLFDRYGREDDMEDDADEEVFLMGAVSDEDLWEQPVHTLWPASTKPYPYLVLRADEKKAAEAARRKTSLRNTKALHHRLYAEARTADMRARFDNR